MKKKHFKKLSIAGLVLIGLVFVFCMVLAFHSSAKDASAAVGTTGAMSLMFFGMASAIPRESVGEYDTLKYTHTAAVSAGDVIAVNGLVLVAVNNALANVENVYIYNDARMTMPRVAATAFNVWDPVFWDNTNGVITNVVAGNTFCGYCAEKSLSADTTIFVMLSQWPHSVTRPFLLPSAVVALADAAATPTAAQMVYSNIFTMTPSAGRNFTTDTAANLVAAIPGCRVGDTFEFTVISLAAFAVTFVAGSGVTLVPASIAANNASVSVKCLFTNVTAGAEAVTIYRE